MINQWVPYFQSNPFGRRFWYLKDDGLRSALSSCGSLWFPHVPTNGPEAKHHHQMERCPRDFVYYAAVDPGGSRVNVNDPKEGKAAWFLHVFPHQALWACV